MEATDRRPRWRRLRVRISVRALLVLVMIAGGGLGLLDHSARTQREAVAVIQKAGGMAEYDWKFLYDPDDPRPLYPKWLADAVGVDYFARVVKVYSGTEFTDEGMAALGRLRASRPFPCRSPRRRARRRSGWTISENFLI